MLGDSAVDRSISGVEKMSKIPERVKKMALDRDFQPSVRIGKTGVTESIVQEIKDQLAKRKIVKIKINKGIFERSQKEEVWSYICNETKSVLVSARGNVGVLWRE
jgi:RNA-binding protein